MRETRKTKEEARDEEKATHMALGMCLGVMAGCLGMSILALFGKLAWGGLSVGIGLLGGMLIGMAIPKKKS